MATSFEVADLREKIQEAENVEPYTDNRLMELIDSLGGVRPAAKSVWESKAASVVDLVNISENGSTRANSDLIKNYLLLAKLYDDEPVPSAVSNAPRTRKITRV